VSRAGPFVCRLSASPSALAQRLTIWRASPPTFCVCQLWQAHASSMFRQEVNSSVFAGFPFAGGSKQLLPTI
jgi:hypothetical protein